MNEAELIKSLYNLNEEELFYRSYQEAKKNPSTFHRFIRSLNHSDCVEKHLVIPELKETMPPSMKDEYFYNDPSVGMVIQKHNCYSPVFSHYHTYFEAFYVYEGICEHEVDGRKTLLRMGDFCIIPPGVSHSISVQDQSIVLVMIMSTNVIENVFMNPTYYKDNALSDFFIKNLRYAGYTNYLSVHTGNDHDLKDLLIKMMLESCNKYQEYDAILYAYFSIFFGKLLRYYENTIEISGVSNDDMFAYRVSTYIMEHHTDVKLADLAEKYHYTPEYTSRLIKKTTGKTFIEILIDCRMKHALSLLKSTMLTISDIAYHIGYENSENFIKTFKKRYGKTPTTYRREM